MSNIREKLVSVLTSVSPRVYRGQAPATLTCYPCVVYHVLTANTLKDLQGAVALQWAVVQLDCLAQDAVDCVALADKLKALEGPGTDGLVWVWQENEEDGLYPPEEQQVKGIERISVTLKLWSN